jgi:hypothetical protein
MRDAKQFASTYYSKFPGLEQEMDDVTNLKPMGEFTMGLRRNAVRRGKYRRLLMKYQLYDDFQKQVWRETPGCGRYISQYELAASLYDIMTMKPGGLSGSALTTTLSLSQQRMSQLKQVATDCGVEADTLASIWILERLRLQ